MSNATEQDQTSQDVTSQPLRTQFTRGESQIAYDFKNKEFISVAGVRDTACTLAHFQADENDALTRKEGQIVLEMTDVHRRMQTLDLLIGANDGQENQSLSDILERTKLGLKKRAEADAKKIPVHYFADTWNILRFVKGNQSMGLNISPNGLNLSIMHSPKGEDRQREDELVLTNMSFTSGLHYWEIVASIGCNNIQVGVHNPISKTEVMASFKTKSKRVITVCLNLYEGVLKFWLNDQFIAKKVWKLFPIGGPWVPCVKIGKERNCLTLNPYANPPSVFSEATLDRGCRLDTILMPLLTNFLCVTGLPQIEAKSQSETLKILNQIFQHSNNQISDIHMPAPGSKVMFCFIKFHHYSYMAEFLDKHRPAGKFKIYEAHEIFEWFVNEKPPSSDLDQPFAVIKKAIALPLKSLTSTLECIQETYNKLAQPSQIEEAAPINPEPHVDIALQVFSDKLILTKGQSGQVKAVARSPLTQEFDLQDVCFSEDQHSLNGLIELSFNRNLMQALIQIISWPRVFKASLEEGFSADNTGFCAETAYHGLFFYFFKSLGGHYKVTDSQAKFYAPIFATKLVLDSFMFHLKRQLKLQAQEKEEQAAQLLPLQFTQQAKSVDELMQLISFVSDLQEQLWAKTRTEQCLPEVKYLCQTISRPQSALNRLGSFVQWPFAESVSSPHSISPFDLAENGFYLKTNEVASTIHNPLLEIQDFSPETMSLQKSDQELRELVGCKNAFLSALPSQNAPLYKALNYLAPQKFTSVTEVICSQNTGFVLVGGLHGSVSICSSQLHLTPIKTLQFFSHDVPKKKQKYLEVYQKLEARNQACIEYQQAICKKEQQIPFIQELAKRKSKSQPKKKQIKKQGSKVKQSLSPVSLKTSKKSIQIKSKANSTFKSTKTMEEKSKSSKPLKDKSVVDELKEKAERIALKKVNKANEKKNVNPVELKDEKIISINKESVDQPGDAQTKGRQRTNSSSFHVLGYTLLSKQATAIDPLMVGCLYQSQSDETPGKFFIRLRRLMFQIPYLLNFIHGSQLSGNMTNLLSGYQSMQRKMCTEQLESILRHQDVLLDLVPVFVRTQVTKKQYPKWESKFPMMMLSEVNEAEVELQGVDSIIDFTNCVYSVASQNHVHILCVQQGKQALLQLRVDHSFGMFDESFVGKIKLVETASIQMPADALRVFQVDDQVAVLCSKEILLFKLDDLGYVRSIALEIELSYLSAQKASICNETDRSMIYTAKNILKFREAGKVPQQQWTLCLTDSVNRHRKYRLVQPEESQPKTVTSLKESILQAHPIEIEQITHLMKAMKSGLKLIAFPERTFEPNYAVLDTEQSLYSRLFFKKVLRESQQAFEFIVELGDNLIVAPLAKKLELELSFKRTKKASTKISCTGDKDEQINWININQTVMKIPLLVEQLKGSQSGEVVFASHLTSPDAQVFVSMYPQPEFIFKHSESSKMILTQINLWSKVSKESQGGFPIGQGFIFFADSLSDLTDSAAMRKQIKHWQGTTTNQSSLELSDGGFDCLYFNFEEQERMTIDLSAYKTCRFIKVIPTGFRSKPINYADCQDFTKDQAELQFFGVSGYLLESLRQELPQQDDCDFANSHDMNVGVQVEVSNEWKEIASAENVTIAKFRTPSSLRSSASAFDALRDGLKENQVGQANVTLAFMPDEMRSKRISVKVKEQPGQHWALSGVSIAVDAIQQPNNAFKSLGMIQNTERIIQTLLNLEDSACNLLEPTQSLEELVGALIEIIEGIPIYEDAKRIQSVLCLSSLVYDSNLLSETQRNNIILVAQQKLNVPKLFQYSSFVELSSPELQKHLINLIELVGLKRKAPTRQATNLLIIQVFQELSLVGGVHQVSTKLDKKTVVDMRHLLSIDVLKNILNLVSRKRRPFVVSKFMDLINYELEDILQQDSDYFKLRSELEINAFPFDIDYLSLDQFNPEEVHRLGQPLQVQKRNQVLPCDFQLVKINSSYSIKAALHQESDVHSVRLLFKMNSAKSIHKFRVSILLHTQNSPLLLFMRTYDESMFSQVTKSTGEEEGSRKKKTDETQNSQEDDRNYFDVFTHLDDEGLIKVNKSRLDPAQELPFTYASPFSSEYDTYTVVANRMTCKLDSSVNGKLFELQVELLDTYRTINKASPFSQVLITPEFFGSPTPIKKPDQSEDSGKPLNQDLEELQMQNVGESLSLSVPSLDLKNRQKASKDAAISKQQAEKQPFIPNKYLPSKFISRATLGQATYDIYSGLAADKTMKSIQNHYMFRYVPSISKQARCASQGDKKPEENAEQAYQDAADSLISAQSSLREELQKERTVKDSKSGMARIVQSCQQISQLKRELRAARQNLPVDSAFFNQDISLKAGSGDQRVERPGFREKGYQTFVSQTDAQVWLQLSQKNNAGILKYAFALSELACVYLHQVYVRDPQLIKDPAQLYKKLFKVFITQEAKGAHPIVEEFLQALYNGLGDKNERQQVIFDLVHDILIKPTGIFNFANFLDYIQSDRVKFISINDVLKLLNNAFKCQELRTDHSITSEQKAIEFLQQHIVAEHNQRKETTLTLNSKRSSSSSGMVIAALSFFLEHVSYRLRICNSQQANSIQMAQLRRQLQLESPELMERISLSNFTRFAAWHIYSNPKLRSGSNDPRCNAFLLCFTEAFLKLTVLNMESLGQSIISGSLNSEEWLIILLAITQSGQAKIHENFTQAVINLMLASKYEVQKEIVHLFNYCLAFLLAQDVSLSQRVYRRAEAQHNNGFSLLFSHYQSLVRIQTKVINVISSKLDQHAHRKSIDSDKMKEKAYRKQQTLPTMSKELSTEFLKQIEIQNQKLGDFINRLLSSLNLVEEKSQSSSQNEGFSQAAGTIKPKIDSMSATHVLVEIYQSLTFLKDFNARKEVTKAIMRQLSQLSDAPQLDFLKSVLQTSEQLVCTPEKMKVNAGLIISLIDTIVRDQLLSNDGHNFNFFQVVCRNLLCLLLTGSNSKALPKRTDIEKQQTMHRKETAATYLEEHQIEQLLVLLTKFVLSRCYYNNAYGTSNSICTILLDFSIANKLCELCLYSRNPSQVIEEAKPAQQEFALNAFHLYLNESPSGKDTAIKCIKQLIEYLVFNQVEEDQGIKQAASSAFKVSAKITQLCQKIGQIITVIGQVNNNALPCLPVLMELTSQMDRQIAQLVQEKRILDLRGIQLQQNANEVFQKMLVGWISGSVDDETSFKFLHELRGFNFIISRLHNVAAPIPIETSPQNQPSEKLYMQKFLSEQQIKEEPSVSEDESSEDGETSANLMKFVGNKIGLTFVKAKSDKIIPPLSLQDRRDTELLAEARVKILLKKQTAIIKTKDQESSPFKGIQKKFADSSLSPVKQKETANFDQDSQVKERLIEKNYAGTMKLVDCTEGQEVVNERVTVKWSFKTPNTPPIQLILGNNEDRRQEYQLTFDLNELVQFTEVGVSLELPTSTANLPSFPRNNNKQSMATGKQEYPYAIILEGKRTAPFQKAVKPAPVFWNATAKKSAEETVMAAQPSVESFLVKPEQTQEPMAKETTVVQGTIQDEELREQMKELTIGSGDLPDWSIKMIQNPNSPSEFSVSQIPLLSKFDQMRYEAQHIRFRFLFMDQIMCTTASSNLSADKKPADKNAKGAGNTQRVINLSKLSVMGANCLEQKEILSELAQMKRKNAMTCLAEYFTKAPKGVLARITKDPQMQRSFIDSFDVLEPFLLLNSSVILPIFIQMASMSEELCTELLQTKILLDYPTFQAKHPLSEQKTDKSQVDSQKEKELEVMLTLLDGLVMTKTEQQISRLSSVLTYVVSQTNHHIGKTASPESKLHINFLVGVANLFVECASLIAKERLLEQRTTAFPQLELQVTNSDIINLLQLATSLQNQTQQKSLILLAIYLLQLPEPFKASQVDLAAFFTDLLLPNCEQAIPSKINYLQLLSLLICNKPTQIDPLIADSTFIEEILAEVLKKVQSKGSHEQSMFSDEQCLELIHVLYNCIGSALMGKLLESGLTQLETIALEFYNVLKPQKVDGKIVIGAEKLKFQIAQALAKTLIKIVNHELQRNPDSKAVTTIIKQIHGDICLTQVTQSSKKKKAVKKTESQNLFVSLVFEPLLKLRITVPVVVNSVVPDTEGKIRVQQYYKYNKQQAAAQSLIPTETLTKENVDMFLKALKLQKGTHSLNISDDMMKCQWSKVLDVNCVDFPNSTVEELIQSVKNKSNLLFIMTTKVDGCQNTGTLPESEQFVLQMGFFSPSMLEQASEMEEVAQYGSQIVLDPNPKENKGSFFFLCGPDKVGSAVFINRDNNQNQYKTDFQLQKFDNGDGMSYRYCFYMMNNIVVSWSPKIEPNQQVWLNLNEHVFQNEEESFKKVFKSVQYKQGLLTRFSVFHLNNTKAEPKQEPSREIGVPKYQLVGNKQKESKKAQKAKQEPEDLALVDVFSSLSVLNQNLVLQVPIDCRLSTLTQILSLPKDTRFVNLGGEASEGLLGTALDPAITMGELQKANQITQLYSQTQLKEEPVAPVTKEKDSIRVFKKLESKTEVSKKEEAATINQTYEFNVFDKYLNLGGSEQMIELGLQTVSQYRNKKMRELFSDFLRDLKMFGILPGFNDLFFKPQDKKELLLEMLKRDYADIDMPKKKVSSEHSQAQKKMSEKRTFVQRQTAEAYEVIETLFKDIETLQAEKVDETVNQFIKSGVLQNLLQSISTMSGEFSRKKASAALKPKLERVESKEKSDEWTDEASSDDTPSEELDVVKVKQKSKVPADNDFASEYSDYEDEDLIKKAMYEADSASEEKDKPKKVVAKKGVGYTTGVGEIWDVNAYLKLKETKNASLLRVFRIIQKFLHLLAKLQDSDIDYYDKMRDSIIESAVLPTIESALRSGSLLEMAKEMELYQTYIQFIEKLASIPSLFDLILDLPPEYEPSQRDSVLSLLVKNKSLSEVFLTCLDQNENIQKISKAETDEVRNPKQLATLFIEVATHLSQVAQQKASMEQQRTIESILALPIDKQFTTLLEDQRFNYYSFRSGTKATDKLDHYHGKEEAGAKNPPSKKLIRLAQEIADLTNSLPVEHTSAIFCRVDKKRVDFMKCLIMGATGTPYANGAFTFDIFFDNKYPEGPPKVQLTTTGGGQVRFNPNLYACGKVCLSLLGTWRGQATENWDPKVSTTLQVLMSIQAIIMSNEVYFNEPGHEQEAGTVDGEKRNTGYSNIIRYATAKYAILEHLENPTKGFEQAIHRSFFVKKQFILDEVDEWIKEAEKQPASYQNLVLDHNYNLGQKFQKEGEYLASLKGVRDDLKVAFEKLKLESSGNVSYNGKVYGSDEVVEAVQLVNESAISSKEGPARDFQQALDQIDVSYGTTQVTGSINIEDEKVKDRWSRYIGAMGIEAVAKQAESTVFISGLGPLGVEIAKNIILAGCKELVLDDVCSTCAEDLDGQFFLEEKDISSTKTRAQLCQMKIQELNTFVKVTVLPMSTNLVQFFADQNCRVKVAVFTDCLRQGLNTAMLTKINEACRNRTQMIVADNFGLFTRVVTDFGPSHTVIDTNGEPAQESMVESIKPHENNTALVTLIKGASHGLQDGDTIELAEVKGMLKAESIEEQIDTSSFATKSDVSVNGNQFKVLRVLTTSTFVIDCDTSRFTKFERDGLVKQIKMPASMEFKPLKEVLAFNDGATLDQNLIMLDFDKMYAFKAASICFKALEKGQTHEQFKAECVKHFDADDLEKSTKLSEIFWKGRYFNIPPLCAFLGGVVAQEVVKGITQKFTPIRQEFYFDAIELYQESPESQATRYRALYSLLGADLVKQIQNTKLFMIGAGAIGCELLKNFAMLGLGSGSDGLITLTDPDVIEVSNLNRQFLFREKHLRKPKSITAAAASIQMNPGLKGHIDARLDKVHADTVSIYSEAFFKSQRVVANALDNVQARIFIDSKCVNARVPLLDSGTLGPKGHVQVIIPFKTESYASQADPEENTAIPHCTLKMFPEETLHCVEWAKDVFGTLFTLNPQNFNKLKTTNLEEIEFHQSTEFKNIKQVIKIAQNRPKTFDDCISLARQKFQKYFHDNILQLLHVYPLDKTLADGRLFWTLPKRPPTAQMFDADSKRHTLHRDFIAAYACLTAKIYGIKIPYDTPRSAEAKQSMAQYASTVEVKPFVSNDQKANQIEAQVDKQNQKPDVESAQEPETTFNPQQLRQQFEKHVDCSELKGFTMQCEEFEKDDDSNFHIDFIHACANIRALNYGLKEMDWLTVKLKAGRIVPALATTTAAIAGLQTIELLKLLKRDSLKLADFKNTYLNLAVPSMMCSEPGAALKTKIKDGLETDLWDRWSVDISKATTMAEVLAILQERYKLSCRDIIFDSTPLFMYALRDRNLPLAKQPALLKSVVDLLQAEDGKSKVLEKAGDFADLTITFVDEDAQAADDSQELILQNIPTVRVTLK